MTMQTVKSGETDLVITRRFASPPERVFAAHTDPDLIRRWMTGPDGWHMTECRCDAVPGGRMRYTWTHDDGRSYTMTGTFAELDPPRRIVHREEWLEDDMPGTRITTTFEPEDGGTLMTLVITYPSAEAREAALATGMTGGMDLSYSRIDGLPEAA